nr:phage tail protein [Providencia sp. PROV037]
MKYFALLTKLGENLLAQATALGTKLELTHMAVGDGGESLPTPDTNQTKLIAEKRRAAINTLFIDDKNKNQIIAEQIIPEQDGGWWIREIGLFDKAGNLIAVANCPETYKPQLAEGSGRTQSIRMVLIVSHTESVTLKIDPSVVLATREYVNTEITVLDKKIDALSAQTKLDLNKKFDKANISGVKGNDNDKVPSLNLLTTEIGKLPTKADLQNITSQTIFARAEAIPQNADLNDYTNAGLFYQASSNPGANAKNYPPNSSAGSLEVVRTGSTSVKQVYTDWYDKKTYTRRYNGGNKTWADKWDEDYTKLNPPTAAELGVYSTQQADDKFQPKGNYQPAGSYQPKGDYVDKTATYEQVVKGPLTANSAMYITSDGVGSDLLSLVTWGGRFGLRKRVNGNYGGTVEVPMTGGTIALVEQTIGINQTWKNLTSSRSVGVSYTNTSNKPILVVLTGQGEGDNSAKIAVDNVTVAILGGIKIYSINRGVSFIVPPGSKYLVESTAVIAVWSELSWITTEIKKMVKSMRMMSSSLLQLLEWGNWNSSFKILSHNTSQPVIMSMMHRIRLSNWKPNLIML